jgi:hypothetical protein
MNSRIFLSAIISIAFLASCSSQRIVAGDSGQTSNSNTDISNTSSSALQSQSSGEIIKAKDINATGQTSISAPGSLAK